MGHHAHFTTWCLCGALICHTSLNLTTACANGRGCCFLHCEHLNFGKHFALISTCMPKGPRDQAFTFHRSILRIETKMSVVIVKLSSFYGTHNIVCDAHAWHIGSRIADDRFSACAAAPNRCWPRLGTDRRMLHGPFTLTAF